ncbi:MAG: B-box zinc finger protein [Dehalococcoidia bacterium]|nr:B-box zinc finger protein [Dehalococcoidia bacterium]
MAQVTYCQRHKDVETSVSCTRCGDPICPSCMVHAPVGVRCLDCARSRPIPTFDVSTPFLLRAIGAGVAVAVLGGAVISGIVWLFYEGYVPTIPYVTTILIAALGYVIGESISLATNRKRGTRLKLVSGVCMLLGFTIITWATGVTLAPINLIAGAIGFYLALMKF